MFLAVNCKQIPFFGYADIAYLLGQKNINSQNKKANLIQLIVKRKSNVNRAYIDIGET